MWACMGPYNFKMISKETKRSPRGALSSPKDFLLREMKCPFNHLSDSQDRSMVREKSILNDQS
jgi:hypothetical protein